MSMRRPQQNGHTSSLQRSRPHRAMVSPLSSSAALAARLAGSGSTVGESVMMEGRFKPRREEERAEVVDGPLPTAVTLSAERKGGSLARLTARKREVSDEEATELWDTPVFEHPSSTGNLQYYRVVTDMGVKSKRMWPEIFLDTRPLQLGDDQYLGD
ncbi:hypothetical protein J437_LFUL003173 [Ladona fulva]|uniref:Uncharacterized protein n=1 Tax=Ladona fulva TaxID=123851 RepID=A0A8K0NTV2_LADFU|nr:hypothetical protein J437_LFUL003173 [Ladona fulva]